MPSALWLCFILEGDLQVLMQFVTQNETQLPSLQSQMEHASGQHSCLSYLWLDPLGHHLLQTVLLILPHSVQGDPKSSFFLLPEAREHWAQRAAASSESTVPMVVFAALSVRMQSEINLEHSYRDEDTAPLEQNLEWNGRESMRILVVLLELHILSSISIFRFIFKVIWTGFAGICLEIPAMLNRILVLNVTMFPKIFWKGSGKQ